MEYSAIFHDMDKRFCYAIDKDLFVIRVQVKKDDMKEVILHYEDKYILKQPFPFFIFCSLNVHRRCGGRQIIQVLHRLDQWSARIRE